MNRARSHIRCRFRRTGVSPGRPRAFTLIELLVVIAILSLLIAVLLPSLAAARRLSSRTKCQANLRSLAQAWHAYLDDNEGRFLHGTNMQVNYGGKFGAVPPFKKPKPLNPYMNYELEPFTDVPIYECPSDRGGGTVVGRHYDFMGTSYAPNMMLIGDFPLQIDDSLGCAEMLARLNDELVDLTVGRVFDQSRVVLLGDFGWVYEWNPSDNQNRAEWHDKKRTHNIVFMDGHVAFTRIHKGLYVAEDYVVIPVAEFVHEAVQCQSEVADE